jgi:hypothetical protein
MSSKVVIFALLALLILATLIFRYRAGVSTLQIDPHAAQEIEKAKQR